MTLCALWLLAASGGAGFLLNYENTPATAGETPAHWPADSRIALQENRPTLLMFAHPRCPCTRASVDELNRLLVACEGRVAAHVLFIQPRGTTEDWADSTLRKSAEAIRGVEVQLDPDGEEAHRFGAESSGYVVLYDRQGQLVFSGGITAARGHAGDNAGENIVIALLNGENAGLKSTPVFGCRLQDKCENKIP